MKTNKKINIKAVLFGIAFVVTLTFVASWVNQTYGVAWLTYKVK